jgi:hypothetical protein
MKQTLKEKLASRKFVVMLLILATSALAMYLPALTLMLKNVNLAAMMTGGEFVSLIMGTFAIYCGANVIQKNKELDVKAKLGESTTETES